MRNGMSFSSVRLLAVRNKTFKVGYELMGCGMI